MPVPLDTVPLDILIRDPQYGVLLRAADEARRRYPKEPNTSGLFRLSSDTYQEDFICLQRVFNRLDDCDEVIRRLGERARALKAQLGFSSVVACTITAGYLLERIHRSIEDVEGEVGVHYLENYPLLNPEAQLTRSIENQRVLILTDVIATGTLVANLAGVIQQMGAEPVGVLAAVVANQDIIAARSIEWPCSRRGRKYDPVIDEAKNALKVFFLEGHDDLRREDEASAFGLPSDVKIINIDPLTVLPECSKRTNGDPFSKPLIGADDMLQALSKHHLLHTGFYQGDGKKLLAAINFLRLFDPAAGCSSLVASFWEAVRARVVDAFGSLPSRLVTTRNGNDTAFLRFVRSAELAGTFNDEPVFVSRHEAIDGAHGYFLPEDERAKVEGQRVLLLLTSLSSGEKLLRLVSLLASYGATQIVVICVANRMGADTTGFLARVQTLVGGMRFHFVCVWDIGLLSNQELDGLSLTLDSLFNQFIRSTPVQAFRDWMKHDMKYFVLGNISGRRRPSDAVDVQFFRTARILADENFDVDKLIHELTLFIGNGTNGPLPDRERLYPLFALLLARVRHFKIKHKFKRVRKVLLDRLQQLREARFSLEDGVPAQDHEVKLNDIIDEEIRLLTGVGLLSYLDRASGDYREIAGDILLCGRHSMSDWLRKPQNMFAYFSEERIGWAFAFLLHLAERRFHKPDFGESFKKLWGERLSDFLVQVQKFEGGTGLPERLQSGGGDRRLRAQILKVRANCDLLLTELGVHKKLITNQQIVRFLHTRVIYTRKRHSPIMQPIEKALDKLREEAAGFEGLSTSMIPLGDAGSRKRRDLQLLLKDAVYACSQLEEVAAVLPRLFSFTPAITKASKRYTVTDADGSFDGDVRRMAMRMHDVRRLNRFSPAELKQMESLADAIDADLFDGDSFLRKTLLGYITWLDAAFLQAIQDAQNSLNRRDSALYQGLWKPAEKLWQDRVRSISEDRDAWLEELKDNPIAAFAPKSRPLVVLAERLQLVEVLRNFFTNAQHAFGGQNLAGANLHERLRVTWNEDVEVKPSESDEHVRGVQLVIEFAGKQFANERLPDSPFRGFTLALHRGIVHQWGGNLHWGNRDGGTFISLTLIKRELPPDIPEINTVLEERL